METAHASPQGLYDGRDEHDACGVAFVATLSGTPTHQIVEQALTALRNLDHRGASGAEPDSGDGAGILTQIPDALLRETAPFTMPDKGAYAVGCAFLPVLPYILGATGLLPALLLTVAGLFLCGAFVTRLTPRSWWYGGLRQVVIGAVAAAVTYLVGSLVDLGTG